jgi:AraC-like DNA-binding protein
VTDPTRGVLFPERLPRFTRVAPHGSASELVEWFWIPEWDLPDGVEAPQQTLGYPAANLVLEAGAVGLWGATTRASVRVLRGAGWALGAVLRPAALMALAPDPGRFVDRHVAVDASDLVDAVCAAMPDVEGAAAAMGEWLVARVGHLTGEARLANDMVRLLLQDASILRIEDAASRLAVSPRTLQRLAHRTVGLPPAAIIRRRRLQEAAQRVRDAPDMRLADVAAELGYADQAHLASDFRTVLGFTPSQYRERP